MIRQHVIDQIFSAAVIEEVIGDYVSLKKRGANMLGLCPFHNEKTPSFTVSPAKGIYKCFGCGRAGNVVGFLMEHDALNYVDALKNLATRYHIEIEEDNSNRDELSAIAQERESLLVALEFARKYFAKNLETEEGSSIGKSYFYERGLSEKTISDFSLGYSMNQWRAFLEEALRSGFSLDVLEKAGLVKHKEGTERDAKENYYDAFRERAMFTIRNMSGKVVAFGGRQLRKSDKSPKYINSPETAVFVKSNILFGLDIAKNSIRQKNLAYLVEGYMDVVSLYQSGIHNVVASSGTSLTQGQIRKVKRFGENITILYDGDKAGINAALRAIDLILEEGLNVRAVTFPEGEDPDSYCQKHGASGLEQYIEENQLDFIRFKARNIEGGDLNDPIKKTTISREVLNSIVKIGDPIKRSAFLVEGAKFLDVDEQIFRSEALRLRNNLRNTKRKKAERSLHREWMEDDQARALNKQQKPEESAFKTNIERERALMRLMVLYGHLEYDEEQNVNEFIIENLIEDEYYFHDPMFKKMVEEIARELESEEIPEEIQEGTTENSLEEINTELSRDTAEESLEEDLEDRSKSVKDERFFTQHPEFSSLAADYIANKYLLSSSWAEKYDIHIRDEDSSYKETTVETLNYLKLSHLEQSIEANKENLKQAQNDEETTEFLTIHHKLESYRRLLTEEIGITGADK